MLEIDFNTLVEICLHRYTNLMRLGAEEGIKLICPKSVDHRDIKLNRVKTSNRNNKTQIKLEPYPTHRSSIMNSSLRINPSKKSPVPPSSRHKGFHHDM